MCCLDDLFLFAEEEGIIEKIKTELRKWFHLKDLKTSKQILAMDRR